MITLHPIKQYPWWPEMFSRFLFKFPQISIITESPFWQLCLNICLLLDYEQMKDNYVNIKKAFMAFDKRQDGFITLDDLKSVLIHFTLPMSDQLFAQLMDR